MRPGKDKDSPSTPELILWHRLAVFADGFTRDGAEAVGARGSIETGAVRDLLSQLVGQSRLVVEEEEEETRYRIPEALAREAYEGLIAGGEEDAVGDVLHPIVQVEVDRWLEPARRVLDEAAQTRAWNEGRAMTMAQAVAAAEVATADA